MRKVSRLRLSKGKRREERARELEAKLRESVSRSEAEALRAKVKELESKLSQSVPIAVAGTCCYGEDKMASKSLKLYPSPENLPIDWLKELAKCHGRMYGKELYRVFYKAIEKANGYPFKGYDLRPTLPRVRSPVIVIYGDRDQLFDLEQALTMHRYLDRSQLCVIPNCGHLPNEERPEDFNRAILNFIRGR